MTTLYALLLQACGLSQREAADFHEARLDTIKSWATGRRQPPADVLAELAKLATQIEHAASEALAQIAEAGARVGSNPETIELGVASDDDEARSLGWPCVGAQCASLARIAARGIELGYRLQVVPRGSTSATAAAADAHD